MDDGAEWVEMFPHIPYFSLASSCFISWFLYLGKFLVKERMLHLKKKKKKEAKQILKNQFENYW